MPEETNKNYKKPKSGYSVSLPRSKPGISQIQVWSVNTTPAHSAILWTYVDIYVMCNPKNHYSTDEKGLAGKPEAEFCSESILRISHMRKVECFQVHYLNNCL